MIFTDLTAGDTIFVDANTLVYRFSLHVVYGPSCTDLLERIERQELTGYTSTHVVSEAIHRLMTLEAINQFGWQQAGIGNRLRTNPAEVTKLSAFRQAADQLAQSKLQILAITGSMLATAAA